MDHKDQRFAEEVLRRTLAKAKSLFDTSHGSLSSTVLTEAEICAATGRATRLPDAAVASYVTYFRSMGAHSNYRIYDASIELLVDVQRTKWPDFDENDLRSRVATLEAQSAGQSMRITELVNAINQIRNQL